MSSQSVIDFLTKQIFIEKNIVTYRSLSRELRIHVNAAKNELATYHNVAPYQSQTCHATYLLSGEIFASKSAGDSQDVDMDYEEGADKEGEFEDDGDEVPQTKVMLVNEKDLEGGRSQFRHLSSIHVYSLAPSPIRDAGLLCTVAENVRAVDRGKESAEIVSIVGRIVSLDIKVPPTKGKKPAPQPVAGPSKPKISAGIPLAKTSEKQAVEEPVQKPNIVSDKPKDKPKATGKLDFSKSKTKETKKSEKIPEPRKKDTGRSFFTADTKKPVVVKKEKLEVPKRGTKRKSSTTRSGSEDEEVTSNAPSKPPSPKSKTNLRLKNRTVLSDDDDDDVNITIQPARKSRVDQAVKALELDAERNVKAMMDVDDDQVMRVTRGAPALPKEEEEESGDDAEQDMVMADEPVPAPKTKKRRPKKVVPVGSNGLRKKRVIKSKESLDPKGYTIFEDYSSYESVDENEEPEPAAPAKGKAKAKAPSKVDNEEEESAPAPKAKPAAKSAAPSKTAKPSKSGAGAGAGAQKQKKLNNFFFAPTKAKD